MYHIFGLKPKEFDATYDLFLSHIHPDYRDHIDNAIKESLNGKPLDIDFRIIPANREERTVHAKGEVVFEEKNSPIRLKGNCSRHNGAKASRGSSASKREATTFGAAGGKDRHV